MAHKIGTITIGQAPRVDVIPDISEILSPFELLHRGALDNLTRAEIEKFKPTEKDYVLVTRLSDGSSVQIAERYILPIIQKHITNLTNEGVDGIVMLCTGSFPAFDSSVPLLYPDNLLQGFVKTIGKDSRLGILTPAAAQLEQTKGKWGGHGFADVTVRAASPYASLDTVVAEGQRLGHEKIDLMILDCIGYTKEMKDKIRAGVKVPVILPRTVAAMYARELFG